jgi:hypothetical protein
MMNSERLILLSFWLSFVAGITPAAGQDINGTWFLNGFHTDVSASNNLPMTESLTGTATIDVEAGSISFNTNLGTGRRMTASPRPATPSGWSFRKPAIPSS